MADSNADQSALSESSSTNHITIPPSLKFVMSNIRTIVSLCLSAENYPLWSSQVLKLLRANGFEGYLTGATTCPPEFLYPETDNPSPNPRHQEWLLIDQNLSVALAATISPSILPYILNLNTTVAIWDILLKRLQATNRSRVIQLKTELNRITLKNNSMTTYLSEVKTLVDQIAAAGSHVDAEDVILHILNGLPTSYQAFKTAIRTRAGPITLDDLYSLLINEEINIAHEITKDLQLSQQALYAARGRGRNSYNRGCGRSTTVSTYQDTKAAPLSSTRPPTRCQICHNNGHNAADCWHRTNLSFSPPSRPPPHALIAPQQLPSSDWVLDSGATSHLTSNFGNLQFAEPYTGSDTVSVGNGSNVQIANSGHGILPTPTSKLHLDPLLHVPHISHSLLSVSSLANRNNCYITFDSNDFKIQDRTTHRLLLTGPNTNGHYTIPSHQALVT